MSKRYKIKKRKSKKSFSKYTGINKRNRIRVMRGGTRL